MISQLLQNDFFYQLDQFVAEQEDKDLSTDEIVTMLQEYAAVMSELSVATPL